jgi:hypothetical protein
MAGAAARPRTVGTAIPADEPYATGLRGVTLDHASHAIPRSSLAGSTLDRISRRQALGRRTSRCARSVTEQTDLYGRGLAELDHMAAQIGGSSRVRHRRAGHALRPAS